MRKFMAIALSLMMLISAIPTFAFELESVENAVEVVDLTEDAAMLSEDTVVYAEKPADYDETKGQLIYFTNFDSSATHTNLAAVEATHLTGDITPVNGRYAMSVKRCGKANGSGACGICFNGWYQALVIVPTASDAAAFTYADGTPVLGEVTMTAELYSEATSNNAIYDVFSTEFSGVTSKAFGNGYYRNLKIGNVGTTWTEFATTPVTVSASTTGFNRIGISPAANCAMYASGVALYVKNPTNALWLLDENGENREFVTVSGESYTFPASKNGVTVYKWTDGESTYAAGTQMALTDVAGKTFTAISSVYASKPADYDETKGQLIYFTNFDSSATHTNLAAVEATHLTGDITPVNGRYAMSVKRCGKANGSGACGICFNGWYQALVIVPTAADASAFTYADGTPVLGEVTMTAELYSEATSNNAIYDVFSTEFSGVTSKAFGNGYYRNLKIGNVSTTWTEFATTPVTVSASTTGFNRIGISPVANCAMYASGVALYVKNPTNALWLTDENGNNREFVIASGENYIFPNNKNGSAVAAWTDGTDTYMSGASAAVADIAGKTFKAVKATFAVKPVDYDEAKGQLVYFTNFDETLRFTNLAAVKASHFTGNLTVMNGRYAMLTKRDDVAAENGCGICFNTWAYDMAVVPSASGAESFTYTDGTPILGKVTLVADVYIDYDNDEKPTAIYDAFNVEFPGEAETVIASSFRSEDARIDKIDTSSGWVNLSTATVTVTEDITGFNRMGFSPTQGSLRKAYYSSVGVYVVPSNGLWLIDANGENREMVVASGESYTFPDEKDGSGVEAWTDGNDTYFAGETVDVSDVAAKTFAPCEADYRPVSLDIASMRTIGLKGIRIAGFVRTALRNTADEYGFVVALAKSFTGGDYSTLTMTNTSVNKISAASYIKGTKDKIYIDAREDKDNAVLQFGDAALDDLGIYFTGVCVGVPENAAAYITKLVGRPYVKIGGNYYYGAVVERSVYDVACDIEANCNEKGVAVPEYAETVIDTVKKSGLLG